MPLLSAWYPLLYLPFQYPLISHADVFLRQSFPPFPYTLKRSGSSLLVPKISHFTLESEGLHNQVPCTFPLCCSQLSFKYTPCWAHHHPQSPTQTPGLPAPVFLPGFALQQSCLSNNLIEHSAWCLAQRIKD